MTATGDVIIIDTAQLILRETPRNQGKIQHWREVLREQGRMPPIEVMTHGKRYFVCDGHHRIAAAKAEGALCVAAQIVTRS